MALMSKRGKHDPGVLPSRQRKRAAPSQAALSRLEGHVDFSGKAKMPTDKIPPPKVTDIGGAPRAKKSESSESSDGRGLSRSIAGLAAATPTRGKVSRIVKSALAMASAGAAAGETYAKYKATQRKAKAKRLSETPSQAVMAKKKKKAKKKDDD